MIRLLFAAAVALFVLNVPIHMTGFGATLGRWAGFCFVAALVPSLIVGLFFHEGDGARFSGHPVATTPRC